VNPNATLLFKYGGIALVALGAFVAFLIVLLGREGMAWRYWNRYTAYLERMLRSMFIFVPVRRIVWGQFAAAVAIVAIHAAVELPLWWVFVILACVAPAMWVQQKRAKRIEAIENQLDGFIQALANALKTTPSIGAALSSIQPLLQNPMREEVELALKQTRIGSSDDQALLDMGARIGSRQVDSALSAVLIGRQVGGNLPRVLETTAATLREMSRLEGVVRTKTAEGKMQLWVLALFPAFIVAALNAVSPGYFDPLTHSVVGYILLTIAAIFWVASLIVARKVLAVDL
jgi:tight adherence protein B